MKVSDLPELVENHMDVWVRYIVNKDNTINDVIKSYDEKNFHALVDYPGESLKFILEIFEEK